MKRMKSMRSMRVGSKDRSASTGSVRSRENSDSRGNGSSSTRPRGNSSRGKISGGLVTPKSRKPSNKMPGNIHGAKMTNLSHAEFVHEAPPKPKVVRQNTFRDFSMTALRSARKIRTESVESNDENEDPGALSVQKSRRPSLVSQVSKKFMTSSRQAFSNNSRSSFSKVKSSPALLARRLSTNFNVSSKNKARLSDFDVDQVIGQGKFAIVCHANVVDGGSMQGLSHFAIKAINKHDERAKKKHILRERNAMVHVNNHQNIATFYFAFQTHKHVFFVNEYHNGGSLRYHLKSTKLGPDKNYFRRLTETTCAFTEAAVCFYGSQIVRAVLHMHKNGIIHRDIKPENIILDVTGSVKVIDFGLAKDILSTTNKEDGSRPPKGDNIFTRVTHDRTSTYCGSIDYMAPEILLRKSSYGKYVDWWAVGVTLYELISNGLPFKVEKDTTLEGFQIQFGDLIESSIPLSEEFETLIEGLLDPNLADRLGGSSSSAKEILSKSFFEKKKNTPFVPSPRRFRYVDSKALGSSCFEDPDDPPKAKIKKLDYVRKIRKAEEDEVELPKDEPTRQNTKKSKTDISASEYADNDPDPPSSFFGFCY